MTDAAPLPVRELPLLALIALELLGAPSSRLVGAVVRGRWSPALASWLDRLSTRRRVCRVPATVDIGALEGNLDMSASLASGRPVHQRGLLEQDYDILLCIGAERLGPDAQLALCRWLDARARDQGPRLLLVDESLDDESGLTASALGDRLPLHLPFAIDPDTDYTDADDVADGIFDHASHPRRYGPSPAPLDEARLRQLTDAALALGIVSIRAVLHTLDVAAELARQAGAPDIDDEAIALAVQLCLAARATRIPAGEPEDDADANRTPPPPTDESPDPADAMPPKDIDDNETNAVSTAPAPLDDRLVAAASAALPEQLLASIARGSRRTARGGGRDRGATRGGDSGRPAGVRRPRGRRELTSLDVLATLREAAPRQKLRAASRGERPSGAETATADRLAVRVEDLRIRRRRQPLRTTTIFVVDASGSAAMHRLGEAKGAVELLLADCYVRRDRVALVTFRGQGARIDLPPTRSLTRAKRCLAALPGGGGTPLASGLDEAARLVRQIEREGDLPVVVLMTDGRPNIARGGQADRERAAADAEHAARTLAGYGARSVVIDTAPRPRADTRQLAAALDARYLPLPRAARPTWPSLLQPVVSG